MLHPTTNTRLDLVHRLLLLREQFVTISVLRITVGDNSSHTITLWEPADNMGELETLLAGLDNPILKWEFESTSKNITNLADVTNNPDFFNMSEWIKRGYIVRPTEMSEKLLLLEEQILKKEDTTNN